MDGYIVIGTELDTKGFDKEIAVLEDKLNDIKATLQMADEDKTLFSTSEVKQMEAEAQRLGRRLDVLKNKQTQLDKTGFTNMKNSIEDVGKSITKAVKKVSKWALAIFGLRSAYMAVRNAINVIAGDDEQLKADIDYIKSAFAYALEPIVRKIVELAKQLMYYVAYIIKAWTGKNIFENANKSLASANKNAKALQKSMLGFDKFNKLGSSSSGGGGVSPSFDLTSPQGETPGWIKWIADNKEEVIAGLTGIATGILAIKLGFDLLNATGIGLIIAGILLTIQGIVDFIKDPSWENFLTILEGIALVVAGIALLMGGWVVALIAVGVAIVAYVIKNWDKVKEILGKVGTWIYDHIIVPVGDFFKGLWDGIKKGAELLWSGLKIIFNGLVSIVKAPLNLIIDGVNKLIGGLNKIKFEVPDWVPVIGGKKLGFNIPKIPRLAKGGIVNMPGRGVNYGGANIAEKKPEGVVPFTDSQQMEILGKSIGKHVKINADITLELESRVLARVMKEIENNYSFARNGG